MKRMDIEGSNSQLPDPFAGNAPNAWLTSFWGISPDTWGFVGFSQESDRASFLRNTEPGCLVVVYVTKQSKRSPELRGLVAGILQTNHEIGAAKNFMPGNAYALKESDAKSKGKWNFGVRVVRAWKLSRESLVPVEKFAPKTYGSAHPQFIGGRGVAFDHTEALKLKSLNVFEIPVYGGRRTFDENVQPLDKCLSPSRAVPRSTSPYSVEQIDGPKQLYILRLKGNLSNFLGRSAPDLDQYEIIKVGYSMSPEVRCIAFNKAIPECAFSWEVILASAESKQYLNWKIAQVGGDEMKRQFISLGSKSLGGEFFLTTATVRDSVWKAALEAADKAMQT